MSDVKEFGEGLRHMENINANWLCGRRVLRRRKWTSLVLPGALSIIPATEMALALASRLSLV